ncbi:MULTISPECIES: PTS sugar transporter subunit IIA [unclassified Agrococcus]|uniref:PTS sugar transporter subunit IIA n=1 Tax=unclassified Agrococcus TaxID=2615065 RepID=UPI003613573F
MTDAAMGMRALPAACAVSLDVTDAAGVLRHLARLATTAGHAEPSFADALVAREEAFPTGLPTLVPVAIPHADPAHVREAGFAVATLARPVPFGVMGTADDRVDVDVVVALLVTEAHAQVEVLAALVDVVQRDGWDASLRAARTPAALAAAFDALLAG